ncbi:MAG TPA: M23 family metallopeptidase [Candidatus Ozemobacteraceae bacterium]|nr:M23 family metallopeptidase [Candidatus Ozemobacteraceae bacterium]HQG28957.1 M23 family metallopeptidase [Candidatus Ozemobacteraceae bacterium]
MRYDSVTKVGVLALLCLLPATLFAALEAPKQKTPAKRQAPAVSEIAPFFGNLDPVSSSRGLVQTFAIKSEKEPTPVESRWKDQPASTVALKSFNGSFLMPVSGEISSRFGRRAHPFRRVTHFHTGIDIRARRGTPIMAAAAGRIVYAGWKRGYGLMVEIEHGSGFRSVYAHCSKLQVRVGTMVQPGSPIGLVGSTGVTTGSHLHFEIMRGSVLLDPLSFFRRA